MFDLQAIEDHPYVAGAVIVGGGLILLYMLGFFGGSSANTGDNTGAVEAYYAASAAQGEAGDQLQIAQLNAQASTTQDLINAGASENINSTWANTDLSEVQANDQAATSVAPYSLTSNLAGDLASVASLPPVTSTTQKSSNGFFGIGAGTNTNVTVQPNPVSLNASDLLAGLVQSNTGTINANVG